MQAEMYSEDRQRIVALGNIFNESDIPTNIRNTVTKLMEDIHTVSTTANVIAQFNMWRGDPHFDEAEINEWLDINRKEADRLIEIWGGSKFKVVFIYHNEIVLSYLQRANNKAEAVDAALRQFQQTGRHFDSITAYQSVVKS